MIFIVERKKGADQHNSKGQGDELPKTFVYVGYLAACFCVSFRTTVQMVTTFEINDDGDGGHVMIASDPSDNSEIRSSVTQATLSVYIKWMFMGSAYGVLVFAVDTMFFTSMK